VELHLTVSLTGSGYHPAAWSVSPLPVGLGVAGLQAMARTAERGRLDAILLGLPIGGAAVGEAGGANTMQLDPLPLLGSLIAVTQRIGLGAAWSVDYTEPYHVARVFATLDHLSHGRTGWIARMFGAGSLAPLIGRSGGPDDPAAYCARADEFIDVVRRLWDSWEDEAYALDKPSGMFVDPHLVHPINHVGAHFAVRGPLNVPRPPQGNPVLVQEDPTMRIGRCFAAAMADVLLTSCAALPQAAARYRELHALAVDRAQRPEPPLILANMMVVLEATEAAAKRRAAALDALVPPAPGCAPRFVGTPEQFVELVIGWGQQSACDGINVLPAVLPTDLDALVDDVVPWLRRLGLFRSDYTGSTLRDHLGLARPRSQFAGSVERVE
jgi:alkanesulfonate monooxygenase SsuD/methylene tetrahydromethanopterin reductase-like flavin-dependent oxidoreductase (luciferase family)